MPEDPELSRLVGLLWGDELLSTWFIKIKQPTPRFCGGFHTEMFAGGVIWDKTFPPKILFDFYFIK